MRVGRMLGIGTRLREERVRRGLEIDEVEAETRIRAKYLLALEDERFDVLPGDVYARAFLRDYAEELGLDAQEMVDELNELRAPPPEAPLTPQPSVDPITSPWEGRRKALGIAITAVVAVVVAVAAGLALVGAINGNQGSAGGAGGGSTPSSSSPPSAGSTHPASTSGATSPSPSGGGHRVSGLALAASGPCWIQVREGSSSGQLLYSGMLVAGQTRHFRHVPVWIRVGAPWDLVLKVRGHHVPWPITGVGDVLVTASGVTAA